MSKVDEVLEHHNSQIESLEEEIKECEEVLHFLNSNFNWLYDKFMFSKNISLSARTRGWGSREGEIGLSDRTLANMMYGIQRQKKMAEELLDDCKKYRNENLAKAILEDEKETFEALANVEEMEE